MENKIEKFLPLGSVVTINGSDKKVMITGYLVSATSTGNRLFDYISCLYPEGVISSDKNILFDHKDIHQVYAIGYSDESQKEFSEKLKEINIQFGKSVSEEIAEINAKNNLSNNILSVVNKNNSNVVSNLNDNNQIN